MNDAARPTGEPAAGLLICRDLIFTSKVTGTAQALGLRVTVAGTRKAVLGRLGDSPPKAIFVDLSAGDAASPEAIRDYDRAAPTTTLIAFGSHVDAGALKAAAEAGCDVVLPRSRFSAELPEILRRALGLS